MRSIILARMDNPQKSKAGPSTRVPLRAPPEVRRSSFTRSLYVAIVALIGCVVVITLSPEAGIQSWWKPKGSSFNGEQHKSLKGSQYLLGVGKADITGYLLLVHLRSMDINCISVL